MHRLETSHYMTTFKILGHLCYTFIATAVVVVRNDSYEAVFSDIFFWAAAFLGTGLMLTVEKIDPKNREKVTTKRIIFSVLASIAIVFVAGTVRASTLEDAEFERNHWFYGIVMLACAIAPELIRLIITESPRAIATGVNNGLKSGVKKMMGGELMGGADTADDELGETDNLENKPQDEQ